LRRIIIDIGQRVNTTVINNLVVACY